MEYEINKDCKNAEDLFKLLESIPQELRERMPLNWGYGANVHGYILDNKLSPGVKKCYEGMNIRTLQ